MINKSLPITRTQTHTSVVLSWISLKPFSPWTPQRSCNVDSVALRPPHSLGPAGDGDTDVSAVAHTLVPGAAEAADGLPLEPQKPSPLVAPPPVPGSKPPASRAGEAQVSCSPILSPRPRDLSPDSPCTAWPACGWPRPPWLCPQSLRAELAWGPAPGEVERWKKAWR